MPQPFPHHYEVDVTWQSDNKSQLTAGDRPAIGGGPPAEFDGADLTRWSPEHLILAALSQCLMLTWIALNKRSNIPLISWTSKGMGTLDKNAEGIVFTEFKLRVRLAVPGDRIEEARRILELAKKHCIISNALKTVPTLEAEFMASTPA